MIWNGPEPLRAFLVPIESLKPDPDNVRVHDDKNKQVVRQLLTDHGQMQVLTVHDGIVLSGNARLGEMIAMGWTHVAVVDLTDQFSKEQARTYAIADNRTGELGEWNTDRLGKQLETLPEWAKPMTGFSPTEWNVKQSSDWAKTAEPSAAPKEHTFKLTADQFAVLDRAVAKVREQLEDPAITRGHALEIIAATFVNNHKDEDEDSE